MTHANSPETSEAAQTAPSCGRFVGQTAIVTASSRGIGFAIAQRLVAEGAKVCLTARKPDALSAAVEQLPEGSAIAIAGKAENPAHREETMAAAAEAFGHVDVLVNSAGANPFYGELLDLPLETARKITEVNLIATLGWIQSLYANPDLQFAERGGAIVNLSSVTGQTASPGIGFYGVTKAAADQLTSTLAVELGPKVRINSVAPALVKTDFSKALYEGRESEVAADYPLGRLGDPTDIADAVAFLASNDARWVTGQIVNLDGGLLSAGGRA